MSPYITFKDSDKNGDLQLHILQRDFPHYCAVLSSHPVVNAIAQIPVAGHNLWIVGIGTIRGYYLPSYPDAVDQFEIEVQKMAAWFYEHRILVDKKRYRKWLIKQT